MTETSVLKLLELPIEKERLENLLPHRGKMVLLSRIIDYSTENNTIRAEYDITKDCLFYDGEQKKVPAWVSIELIAQAASALTGIKGLLCHMPPKAGFLLSVMNYESTIACFDPDKTVQIYTSQTDQVNDICKYTGEIYIKDSHKPVITATISVMETENIKDYIKE
ncbi:MAG: 3-hydroxylacyl-ACP dehydratase [Treponema sp.]|nr:3-hydroxylacyl-ACP dehydratase [Treponema sp.]